MHHLYLSYQPSEASLRKEREALEGWCREGGINDYKILEEKLTSGRISHSQLAKLLEPVHSGDTVVATSLSRLGRSINMLLSVLKMLHDRGVTIITINEGLSPAKIALQLGVSRGTVANYIKAKGLER